MLTVYNKWEDFYTFHLVFNKILFIEAALSKCIHVYFLLLLTIYHLYELTKISFHKFWPDI